MNDTPTQRVRSTFGTSDRILAFLLALGVLAAVFGLRACRDAGRAPPDPVPERAP